MTGRHFVDPISAFERSTGHSRAVVDGEWVFVSGLDGLDETDAPVADDIVGQARRCLDRVASALRQSGAGFDDVVRVTYIVADAAEFERVWPLLRQRFGEARPAATTIHARLPDARARIAIEVTARKRRPWLGGEAPTP